MLNENILFFLFTIFLVISAFMAIKNKNLKRFFLRETKNRNKIKIKKKYHLTTLQIYLFPFCYLWVNLIYIVTYTRNYVLILVSLMFVYLSITSPEHSPNNFID